MELIPTPGAFADFGFGSATELRDAPTRLSRVRLSPGEPLQKVPDQRVQGRRPVGSDASNLPKCRFVDSEGQVLHVHIIRVTV
jgi:hypothetical protein